MNQAHHPDNRPSWVDVPANRLLARGHMAGDLLEAYDWEVTEERAGFLRISAHLPAHVRNPRNQLFGGFTPTYVDLVSLFTVRAGPGRLDPKVARGWMATVNMRIDYFEPIRGPRFDIVGELEHVRGRTSLVSTKMYDDDTLAAHAITTLRSLPEPN